MADHPGKVGNAPICAHKAPKSIQTNLTLNVLFFFSAMPERGYLGDLQVQNGELQRELGNLKKELELTNQKLGSSMHSIKTFWSPELKKERALRKEESAKYSLINDQLKLLNSENQVWTRLFIICCRTNVTLTSLFSFLFRNKQCW